MLPLILLHNIVNKLILRYVNISYFSFNWNVF